MEVKKREFWALLGYIKVVAQLFLILSRVYRFGHIFLVIY